MAKKEQEQLVVNGKRIKGRKASLDKYIPFYEFLLYDPTYREMKEKAKILYSFLRKKTAYFEERTEAYEMLLLMVKNQLVRNHLEMKTTKYFA